ncbi:MAG: GNAT family N-acetyltransferase [Gammaproteobacteria bacterium]|nr:GNAT family N-acetyltransferase [Gammaproteobacteria bacterium]
MATAGQVAKTDRLALSFLSYADAEFVLRLLNDPGFLRYIGDKGVRNIADARNYLDEGPLLSYATHGFGLFRVALRSDDTPIGICGLLKRDYLDDPDIGFALLPDYSGSGYAIEASQAAIEWGRAAFGFTRIVGIVDPDNDRSIALLKKLGMHFERRLRIDDDERETSLYSVDYV